MSRIAKADVNRALDVAAKTILAAGGKDGRTSRAEITAATKALKPAEKELVDILFKFIDNRDFKSGAQVTASDVKRGVEYAKKTLIAKYDLNNDGLSKDEIGRMSLTGKRAVDLARALKAAGTDDGAELTWRQVAGQLTTAAENTFYVSESDSQPEPLSGTPANANGVTPENVKAAFGKLLEKALDAKWNNLAMEIDSAADSKSFLKGLTEAAPDDEQYVRDNAAGFARIKPILEQNLTDLRVVKVGPKEDGGLASDSGAYQYLLVGKTHDGSLAGVHFEAVET